MWGHGYRIGQRRRVDTPGRSRVEKAPDDGWYVRHWYGTDWAPDFKTAIESANIYAHLSKGRFDVR